jgi:hypothetical protein
MTTRKSLVDNDETETVEHTVTLGEVLAILASGIALPPQEKKTVMDFAAGLAQLRISL